MVSRYCPGGNRVIPLPGYWSENELSTPVSCSPASVCAGGFNASCSVGYEGRECGSCAQDFYR